MTRSATEVMHDIVYAAVLDGIQALKAASKGMPNTLTRDINAIHANTTFADLPKELQDAIAASVRGAFNRLLKDGYTVTDRKLAPPPPRNVPSRDRPPPRSGQHRGDRGGRGPGGKPPPGNRPRGGKPGGGGKPGPRT